MPGERKKGARVARFVEGVVEETKAGFARGAAGVIQGLPHLPQSVARLRAIEFEMKGSVTETETEGWILLSPDQRQEGTELRARLEVVVDHPPEGATWQLGAGFLVVDERDRAEIYRITEEGAGPLSRSALSRAPIWRLGRNDYLVGVPGDDPLAVRVREGRDGFSAERIGAAEAFGLLSELLADGYERVLGRVQKE